MGSDSVLDAIGYRACCDHIKCWWRSRRVPPLCDRVKHFMASSSNGVFRACPTEDVAKTVVALMARVLEDLLGIVFGERHRERPGPCPDVRIVHCHLPV